MRYNEQLPIKLYDKTFTLQAIIDDYAEISFSHNLYEAGDFSISINYNIPNAQLFQRGMFIQFGNDEYMFGEILSITDTIAQDGKGSQTRTITGKDARFLFKRRVIKNMNSEGSWVMTAKGELCMRNLIADQCGVNAEEKRRLPIINNIPSEADALGASYSVSESFSNLYDTLVTIATQSEIGWRVRFTGDLILEVYRGTDLSNNVQFSTDFDSLSNGTFTDTSESFANTVYVGGKGTGEDRDVYEGEIEGAEGLDRYEAFDNQSGMTTESEYETEALSILSQYGQTITVNGNGLAKCPYIFKEQYNIGDIITIAFSGKSAKAQILGVTEHWGFGAYGITFSFGKPVNDLNRQLQLILKQIQKASNKTTTTSSVKYYTIPTDTEMPAADVIYDTIGFTGTVGTGATFKLYLDNEKTGAKTYHVYFKQLGGTGKLTLTTGVTGASNLVMNAGTYVAIIYVDNLGNVTMAGATATNTVEAGNTQPVTSDGVNSAISGAVSGLVTGVKGNAEADYRTGNVNITKANIGLGNVDNTSDADKPVSTAQATAISTAETNAKNLANATGTLAIAHGGTGADSQANINTNFIADLSEGTNDVTDGTMFVSSYASDNGFSDTNAVNKPYKRKFSHVWNYIKGKIGTAFGLQATKTDNAVARWDGTDGKLQNSGVTIDDNADMTVNNVHIGKGKSIYADGTKANTAIIKMKDNTSDAYGNGIVIGGGGAVVIGAGESADTYYSGASLTPVDKSTRITADGTIVFVSNLDSNYASRKEMTMGTDGKLTNNNGFVGYLTGNISGSSTSCTGNSATATTATNGVFGRLGGANQAVATTFTALISEVSNATGGGGICGGSINTSAADKGVPAGWYNFLYIPHRNGTGGGENYKYGTLLLYPMTSNSDLFYVIHHTNATVNNAKVFSCASSPAWSTARDFTISDNDSTNSGPATSVDGSSAVNLKLPSTIKASLDGNSATATTATNGVFGRLGGANQAVATTFTALISEVSNATGGGGICGGSINTSAADKGVPAGWYNFLYIPHRNGTGGGENYKYGTLLLYPMTSNSDLFYVIHHTNATVNNAKVFSCASSPAWSTARDFTISDNDSTNSGPATSVDGSSAVNLKLPSTIKASLDGNSATATMAYKIRTSAPSSPEVGDIWIS